MSKKDDFSKKSAEELAQDIGIDLTLKQKASVEETAKKQTEEKDKKENKEQNKESQEEKIEITQSDLDLIKLQMANMANSYKELEKDFENYRLRTKDNLQNAKLEGVTKAVLAFSEALDTFDKAKKMVKDKTSLDGIEMIEKSILQALNTLGVQKIETKGKTFDPDFHTALAMQEVQGAKSGTIIDEAESGYILDGKVIKFSKVIVAK